MLNKVSYEAWTPPCIVGLPATPIQASPHDLTAFVKTSAWGPSQEERLIAALKDWSDMAANLGKRDLYVDPDNRELVEKIEREVGQCRRVADDFMRAIGIKVLADDKFFGHNVTAYKSQPLPERTCCEPPSRWAKYIVPLCESSRQEAVLVLEKMKAKAEALKGTSRARPNIEIADVIKRLSPADGVGGKHFAKLEIVATIPALAEAYATLDNTFFDHKIMEKGNFAKGQLIDTARHPWYHTIRRGMGQCPKLVELFRIVNIMLEDKTPHIVDDENGDKVAKVFKKRAAIYSKKPLVAQLVALALRIKFPGLYVVLLYQGTDKEKEELILPFSRVQQDEEFKDNAVLVTTTRMSGTGLDLTRCNYAILMDASDHISEKQALARVDRWGQYTTVHLYRLVAMSNPAERLIAMRSKLRGGLYSRSAAKEELLKIFSIAGENTEADKDEGATVRGNDTGHPMIV